MNKIISTADFEKGEVILLSPVDNYKMLKVAQEATTEAQKFIYSLPRLEDKFYCLVIALGAGEYWGANRNGDYFPEEELKKSYHTFKDAHVFELHKNDDPAKAIGRVLAAFWNDKMKRVELVIEVDKVKGYKYLQQLERGETVDVSMGCKVEYDVCSICGNRSKTRLEYCDHLRYHMNEVLPDGRKVYAINPNPKFFDISFVRRGADPTAKVLLKVAEAKEGEEKVSAIEKEVPALATKKISKREARRIIERANAQLELMPDIPADALDELVYEFEPHDILYTLAVLGIPVKLEEFRLILRRYPSSLSNAAFQELLRMARFTPGILLRLDPELLLKRSFFTQQQITQERLAYPADERYDDYHRIVIIKMADDNEVEKAIKTIAGDKSKVTKILFLLLTLIIAYKQMQNELRMLKSVLGISGVGVDPRWQYDLKGYWDATTTAQLVRGVIPTPKNLLEQHGNLLGGIIAVDRGLADA
ncbi:MAG: hypothetical protein QXE80_03340 [Pyrobaculum sp.]